MDWQTNKGKPSDINVGIKEVVQDSSESSIMSDEILFSTRFSTTFSTIFENIKN